MDFQHDKSWDNLQTVLNSKMNITGAWNKFIDFHEHTKPKPYWTSLRQLDLETEQTEIKDWLEHLVKTSPLPQSVIALWIGIIKTLSENEEEIPTIYLVGSDTYDKDDIDWACDPTYMPDNRYVCPGVLIKIDGIIKNDEENYEFLDWLLPLAYCSLTLDEITREKLNKKLFLTSKKKLFVATGHDSGDYLDIATIE
jgi:hypothetical protein